MKTELILNAPYSVTHEAVYVNAHTLELDYDHKAFDHMVERVEHLYDVEWAEHRACDKEIDRLMTLDETPEVNAEIDRLEDKMYNLASVENMNDLAKSTLDEFAELVKEFNECLASLAMYGVNPDNLKMRFYDNIA